MEGGFGGWVKKAKGLRKKNPHRHSMVITRGKRGGIGEVKEGKGEINAG